ncbi:MAG: PAS domain-containing protein [Candidatus Eisenbacteria bacterium]|nr:PAS domain-containing protein [Candidatus Eisenbacteria bacterium]
MQVPLEGLSAEALSALRSILSEAGGGTPGRCWAGDLAWVPRVYGAAQFALVGFDREGTAHLLGGSLASEIIDPVLLELLESEAFWTSLASGTTHPAARIAEQLEIWPAELPLAARPLSGAQRLGVLLLREGSPDAAAGDAAAGDATPEAATASGAVARDAGGGSVALGDRLLLALLEQWRWDRERRWLGGFSRALIAVQKRGLLAVDGQGRVVHLNRQGAEMLGVTESQAIGSDCTRVLRPLAGSEHPLLEGLAGRLERIELFVRGERDREVPISLRMERIYSPLGETIGLVALFRDPSLERAFDQESRRRERLAVIGELAAGVAHEIRNPLTGIGNCAQVLQQRFADDEGTLRMADLILRESQRLDRIVTSLLKFAHPGPPRMRATAIEEVVATAVELEAAAAEQCGVRQEVRVDGRIPQIYIDPEQIQQVLVNLIRNAHAAMPDAGVLSVEISVVRRPLHLRRGLGRRATDRVRVPRKSPQGRFARLRVRDTGCGISPQAQGRIFDPFFTTRSGGTGLGLSVSQSIIQEHGGTITVQSGPGAGTVFEIDLPVERRQGERRR